MQKHLFLIVSFQRLIFYTLLFAPECSSQLFFVMPGPAGREARHLYACKFEIPGFTRNDTLL